jgi:hypothetical protein
MNDKMTMGVDMGSGRDVSVQSVRLRNGSVIVMPVGCPFPPEGLRIGGVEVPEELEDLLAAAVVVREKG